VSLGAEIAVSRCCSATPLFQTIRSRLDTKSGRWARVVSLVFHGDAERGRTPLKPREPRRYDGDMWSSPDSTQTAPSQLRERPSSTLRSRAKRAVPKARLQIGGEAATGLPSLLRLARIQSTVKSSTLRTDAKSRGRADVSTPRNAHRLTKLTNFQKSRDSERRNLDGCFGFPRY